MFIYVGPLLASCTQAKASIHCTQVPETFFNVLFLEQVTQLFYIEFQKQVLETFAVYAGLKAECNGILAHAHVQ